MGITHRILVTGAKGFIGSNLLFHLRENLNCEILTFTKGDSKEKLVSLVEKSDFIIHLAGVNRPQDTKDFTLNNTDLTKILCDAIRSCSRNIPLIFTSSLQAEYDNAYGESKLLSEKMIETLVKDTGNSAIIYRLPGVFGKWCKPNYNSVVATFCYSIARELPITITDPSITLNLVYVDDLIHSFIRNIEDTKSGLFRQEIKNVYNINLDKLAKQIIAFKNSRVSLISEPVGEGFLRALYSTYISYLPADQFFYDLPQYKDNRGNFVEMLKTKDSGQFSFFTVHPGVTRGSHYHHTKTEKFLVVSGIVRMRFRHLITGEASEIIISADLPKIIDSIPGWAHDITNISNTEAIIILWANEIFDHINPDCIPCEV